MIGAIMIKNPLNKLILFAPSNYAIKATENPPQPSSRFIPTLFKDIRPEKKFDLPNANLTRYASTIKKCLPVTDAFTSGYMVSLPQDVEVKKIYKDQNIFWMQPRFNDEPFIMQDEQFRSEGTPIPYGHNEKVWRFHTSHLVTTPKGYSSLITHPFNRFDLPFTSLTGVIDTDKLKTKLIIQFYVRDDFEGVIPKGTPLAQILPFKRESWNNKVREPLDPIENYKNDYDLFSKLNRPYQTTFWSKKEYK